MGVRRGRRAACAAAIALLPALAPASRAAAANANANAIDALLIAVRADQVAVVNATAAPPIRQTEMAITAARSQQATAKASLGADRKKLTAANKAVAALVRRSAADQAALTAGIAANATAQANLAGDRSKLRTLAVDLYTHGLQASLPPELPASEDALFNQTEALMVANDVIQTLHQDVATADHDATLVARRTANVNRDGVQLAGARLEAAQLNIQAATDTTNLTVATGDLDAHLHHLAALTAAEKKAEAALAGPASVLSGLSVLGPSALSAAQLAAWYTWTGYADLTTASIKQLAGWYIQEGHRIGVRGDVAFAQAILETGGFSSPDAVDLNNYAGIGHCDSCASGWAFPSPQDGVIGQLQLLSIFAGPGLLTVGLPPVLPALTNANEGQHGCCNSWESLTGVWASDPTYAAQILGIYDQILQYALGGTVSP